MKKIEYILDKAAALLMTTTIVGIGLLANIFLVKCIIKAICS